MKTFIFIALVSILFGSSNFSLMAEENNGKKKDKTLKWEYIGGKLVLTRSTSENNKEETKKSTKNTKKEKKKDYVAISKKMTNPSPYKVKWVMKNGKLVKEVHPTQYKPEKRGLLIDTPIKPVGKTRKKFFKTAPIMDEHEIYESYDGKLNSLKRENKKSYIKKN